MDASFPMPSLEQTVEDESYPLVDNTPTTPVEPPHNPEDMKIRAAKYDFALGERSPGQDALLSNMQSNLEESDRFKEATRKTIMLSDLRNNMVKSLADQAGVEGRPFTEAESSAAVSMSDLAVSDLQHQAQIDRAAGEVPGTLVQNPQTIFEREYAEKVIANAVMTGEDTPYDNAYSEDGNAVHGNLDVFSDKLVMKEAYQKLAEELDAQAGSQSWVGWGADFIKGAIPGYTYFKSRNLLGNTPGFGLFGSNMLDNIHAAYSGRPEETIPQVRQALKKIAEDNPSLASQIGHALVDYPSSVRLMDNILITGGDVLGVTPFGLLRKGASKALEEGVVKSAELKVANQYQKNFAQQAADAVKTAAANPSAAVATAKETVSSAAQQFNSLLKNVTSTVMKPNATLPEILDSAGQVTASAATAIVDKIVNQYSNIAARSTNARDLLNELPGWFNALEVTGGIRSTWATKVTSEAMQDILSNTNNALKAIFLDALKANKYGEAARAAAVQAAESTFKMERRDLENSIMNVFENPVELGLGDHQVVIHIGKEDATPFNTAAQAHIFAELHGLLDHAKAVPAGNGWAIQIQRPMDFTEANVRKAMQVDAKANGTPYANVLGRFLTGIRSGEDTMPKHVVEAMKIATYGSSGLEQMVTQAAKRIGKLRGDSKEAFQNFIKSEQMERNPLDPEKMGAMSRDPSEFEQKWMDRFNRLPTQAETDAYFTYRFINDMHYAALNLSLYLDKNALGLQNLRVSGLAGAFEGKVVSLADMFAKESNGRVMVLEEGLDPKFYGSRYIKAEDKEAIEKLIKQGGYTVHQVSDVGADAIKAEMGDVVGRNPINFVIAKGTRAEPLSLKQIPYQPGIHNITPDGGFISQGKLGFSEGRKTTTYYGDTNLFYTANEKIGKDFAQRMETFRTLLQKAQGIKKKVDPIARAQAIAEAKAYAKKNLPVSWSQLTKDFSPKGRLDIDSPILYRASNQSLADAHDLQNFFPGTQFIKHADSDLNLYRGRVNLEFATRKGDPIREIVNRGDPIAPVYGMRPAPLLDPMAALDRGVSAMVRGRYFEPLKVQMADAFVAEFGDLLNVTLKEAQADPFRVVNNFEDLFRKNMQGSDLERLKMARSYAARARQFFGTVNNQETKFWKYVGQKIIGTDNPDAAGAWRKSLSEILKEGDPAQTLRYLAYFPKMGFWNPKQLLQQGNTIVNVVALSPKHGWKSGFYSMWSRAAMMDPKLLPAVAAKIDESAMSKALGMTGKEFTQIIEDMQRSGFGKMGREVATREQHLEGSVVQTAVGGMLSHGLFFMREGEEFVRRAAWFAAYLEKQADKAGRKLTDQDLSGVLNRADFYNVNMSHASNASWQQGIGSVPTQFWSYQIRMMEQLTGKRMKWQERARLLGAYSLFYGVPIGVTAALPIWPAHESIKEYLISKNFDTDDYLITKVLNDGILSNIGQMVGLGDTNIENVYGPSGIPILKDLYDGTKGWADIIGGASGNVIFNTLVAVAPIVGNIKDAIIGNPAYQLKSQDFVDVLSNISTVSTLEKMYIAATTQKYLTKYGQVVGTGDSVFKMLMLNILGVQPQEVDNMYRTMQVNKNYDDYIRKLNRWVQEDIRNALGTDDQQERAEWFKRAQVKATWFPKETERQEAFYRVMTENKTFIERARQMHSNQSQEALEYEIKQRQKGGVQ